MLCAVIVCCELAGCAPASCAEGHETRTWVLPTGHEPFVSWAKLQGNPLPWTRRTHKSEIQQVDWFVLNLGTSPYQQRGSARPGAHAF